MTYRKNAITSFKDSILFSHTTRNQSLDVNKRFDTVITIRCKGYAETPISFLQLDLNNLPLNVIEK